MISKSARKSVWSINKKTSLLQSLSASLPPLS
jgi:hypothetical protein